MQSEIQIHRAALKSATELSERSHDEQARIMEQLAQSEGWEVRVKGELAALGGFAWRDDLDAFEAWLAAGPALRPSLRASIDALGGVLDVQLGRGAIFARIKAGADASLRLCHLIGFDRVPAFVADGHGFHVYGGGVR